MPQNISARAESALPVTGAFIMAVPRVSATSPQTSATRCRDGGQGCARAYEASTIVATLTTRTRHGVTSVTLGCVHAFS
ncbi:hypothetical protein C8J57DRAFT_1514952 [Mycena rebaudengoi]|nr:hypothetical protein C8J57DRAFT_1514952 [Mycena rebaudengoi]